MSRCFLASALVLSSLSAFFVGCSGGSEGTIVPAALVSDTDIKQMQTDSEATRREQAKFD